MPSNTMASSGTQSGYIVSVGKDNATSDTDDFSWFILRARKQRPFNSLNVDAPLFWYDRGKEAIFLLTRLTKVAQCEYTTTESLREWLVTHYGKDPSPDPYFIEKAGKCRYCVAFWVHPLQRLNLPKPNGCKLDRDGWLPCDSEDGRLWLSPLVSNDPDGHCGPDLRSTAIQLDAEGYFDRKNLVDERQRRLQEVVQRRGQPNFRAALIDAYDGRCAVTGYDAVSALEAAHITPYLGPHSNQVSNGLLLRADIHTLFDLDLIGVDPASLTVVVAAQLRKTYYEEIHGKAISIPTEPAMHPDKVALQKRWERFSAE